MFGQIRLVIWKNIRLRTFHWFIAVIEIIFPILVFHQGLHYHKMFQNNVVQNIDTSITNESDLYSVFKRAYVTLFYTPKSNFTDAIFEFVLNDIDANDVFNNHSEYELELLFTNKSYTDNFRSKNKEWISFAVIFDEESVSFNSAKFAYKLRAPSLHVKKNTRFSYINEYASPSVIGVDEYITSGFLGLQYALNKAFYSYGMNTNGPLPSISIQRFPCPRFEEEHYPEDTIYSLTLIGFLFLAVSVPHYIAMERSSGLKQLMKTMGLHEWIVWFGWITYTLMIYPIIITGVIIVLTVHLSDPPFYENISPYMLWLLFMLYCISNLVFLFAVSSLFNRHWVAVVASVITWFITSSRWLISIVGYHESRFSLLSLVLLSFFPNLVMYNALRTLEYFELKGSPTYLSTILVDIVDPNILQLRYVVLLFFVNIILNAFVTFYFSRIFPGRFGLNRSLLFPITGIFHWCKNRSEVECSVGHVDYDFFEKVDSSKIGLRLRNIQKKYGIFKSSNALNDINLDICFGDITVLLGHNGAGKTTLMNIIAGMIAQSSGCIHYLNADGTGTTNMKKTFQNIGYCAQENVYFGYLTVKQHLLYFSMLKGESENNASNLADELLRLFRLHRDSVKYVDQLSAGHKRKLSLLIALIGHPNILILDEPTIGMDLISRKRTWKLLKAIKNHCIIVITTQDMEEADVLGDRMAVLQDGQVFCYGSRMFLKTTFGTGYTLIISKEAGFETGKVATLIQSLLPNASFKKESEFLVSFTLPMNEKKTFPILFAQLENQKNELKIEYFEVTYSNMEQIFFSITTTATKDNEKFPFKNTGIDKGLPVRRRTGFSLVLFQILALLRKRLQLMSRRYLRLFATIFFTILSGILNIKVVDWSYELMYDTIQLPIELTLGSYFKPEVFYWSEAVHANYTEAYIQSVQQEDGILVESVGDTIQHALVNFNHHNPYEYKDNLVAGCEFSVDKHTVFYNPLLEHSAPIAINIYSQTIFNVFHPNQETKITTINHPFASSGVSTFCSIDMQKTFATSAFWWVFLFNSAVVTLFGSFMAFMVSERDKGTYHLQTMSNLSYTIYWISNWFFDYAYYIIICAILIVTMKLSDSHGIFEADEASTYITILLLYGTSAVLYSYLFSTVCNSITIFIIVNIPLNICLAVSLALLLIRDNKFAVVIELVISMFSPFVFFNIIVRYLFILINNKHCVYCLSWESSHCEGQLKQISFMESGINKLGDEYELNKMLSLTIKKLMSYLVIDAIVYAILLLIVHSSFGKTVGIFILNLIFGREKKHPTKENDEINDFVENEKSAVAELVNDKQNTKDKLVVHGLWKNFMLKFRKHWAVKDINFVVSRGQCFGLVGMNGAGKSTAFKVLSGHICASGGNIFLNTYNIKSDRKKYATLVGYCAQTNAIYNELTAKEMLQLVASLRGLRDSEDHVKQWLSILEMEDYQDAYIDTYSSGTKRKLSIALAMIGYPLLVLLDEPTAGIDPSSRRRIYSVIKLAKSSNQIVIFSTHVLRECENLCDRVAILEFGKMAHIGKVSQLKQVYSAGFNLMVRISLSIGDEESLNELIDTIQSTYGPSCKFKDHRQELLQFIIKDSYVPWSILFQRMETLKDNNDMIQDYILSLATMDEGFVMTNEGLYDLLPDDTRSEREI